MSEATAPAAAPSPAAPAKKGKGKLFAILAVVLVLLGGGGAAAFFMLRKPAEASAEAGASAEPAKKPEANGIVTFEPFVVNLADTGGRRFLRINVRLLVPELEEAEHIQKSEVLLMRLRSEILELLTAQTSEQVVAPEGKTALKAAIVEHARHIVEPTEVADVLFSDFVVQDDTAAAQFMGMLDVRCQVEVVVGHGSITVRDCLRLQRDTIIKLREAAGADLLVQVQGIVAATGEIVVDDETTSVKITEILPPPGPEVQQ